MDDQVVGKINYRIYAVLVFRVSNYAVTMHIIYPTVLMLFLYKKYI